DLRVAHPRTDTRLGQSFGTNRSPGLTLARGIWACPWQNRGSDHPRSRIMIKVNCVMSNSTDTDSTDTEPKAAQNEAPTSGLSESIFQPFENCWLVARADQMALIVD